MKLYTFLLIVGFSSASTSVCGFFSCAASEAVDSSNRLTGQRHGNSLTDQLEKNRLLLNELVHLDSQTDQIVGLRKSLETLQASYDDVNNQLLQKDKVIQTLSNLLMSPNTDNLGLSKKFMLEHLKFFMETTSKRESFDKMTYEMTYDLCEAVYEIIETKLKDRETNTKMIKMVIQKELNELAPRYSSNKGYTCSLVFRKINFTKTEHQGYSSIPLGLFEVRVFFTSTE